MPLLMLFTVLPCSATPATSSATRRRTGQSQINSAVDRPASQTVVLVILMLIEGFLYLLQMFFELLASSGRFGNRCVNRVIVEMLLLLDVGPRAGGRHYVVMSTM